MRSKGLRRRSRSSFVASMIARRESSRSRGIVDDDTASKDGEGRSRDVRARWSWLVCMLMMEESSRIRTMMVHINSPRWWMICEMMNLFLDHGRPCPNYCF